MNTLHPIRFMRCMIFNAAILSVSLAAGAEPLSAQDVSNLHQWSGVDIQPGADPQSADVAVWSTPGTASFSYPEGPNGWSRVGLSTVHDGSRDWRGYHGLRFDLYLPEAGPLTGEAVVETTPTKQGSRKVSAAFRAPFGLVGQGWHTVTLPWDGFSFEKDRPSVWMVIKTLRLAAAYTDGRGAELKVKNVHLIKADRVALSSPVRSRSAAAGDEAGYTLELTNCTAVPQVVRLTQSVRGREAMTTTITPELVVLAPHETHTVTVNVHVAERVAPGGHERQLIRATANGDPAGTIEYITLRRLGHPYVLHTPERWDAVRQKIKEQPWAQKEFEALLARADKWQVPAFDEGKISRQTHSPYLFGPRQEHGLMDCAMAYELSGDLKYAQKAALFLKRLSDPQTGYPVTLQANSNNLVKEGGVFQKVGQAYDLIYEAGVLSDDDHQNLETTFRLYFDIIDEHISRGTVSNWYVSEWLGAVYCALAIQDLAVVERFIKGPGGFYDQMTHGVMGDGWWFECSIGYNTWVAKMFTELSLALQPWGVDYLDAAFPAGYSLEYNVPYADVDERMNDYYGKPFQKYGAIHKPFVKITDMWDALLPYIDYSGVMFALNDSTEKVFSDNAYELAYAVYGKPEYASVIKLTGKRDLIYGVPELPADTPALGQGSAYSDNAGVTMLRSQAQGKDPSEKIQAVLKYGTHGGYHGHFDRAGLNSLMRYGRSFYNPEHIWYSYPNYMYAFFVQTSLPHNMVVVDMKQQEPVDSKRLLFSTGEMLQATAVQTHPRWSRPPFGGLAYENYFGRPFSEKIWDEGRYLPIPEDAPRWGDIGPYTDYRVMQRRLLAVTDDYVLLADHLDSPAPEGHTFDCLFNIKGLKGIDADRVQASGHTEQMDPNPLLAAQFITDCDWYQTSGTTKVSFETRFGPGADNAGTRIYGADGVLKMDVYNAWPREREVMIGTLPEAHRVNRKLWYTVSGDDQTLAQGQFGAWVLGRDAVEVSVEGLQTLTLTTKAAFNAKKAPKTLFWGDPVIVTADGREVSLADLNPAYAGIDDSPKDGLDYRGGPVKIAGRAFARNLPANPVASEEDGTITIDLTGLDAVRFKAHIGGDYPLGDEAQRRKSLSFRTTGSAARYLTVIEPYEDQAMVTRVTASSADQVTVELADGRTHVLTIQNLEQGTDLGVQIREYRDGQLVREESTR